MNVVNLSFAEVERDSVLTFGGLCRQPSVGEGEMAECENMTDKNYPFAASGGDFACVKKGIGRCYGLLAKDSIARVCSFDGNEASCRLFYGELDTGLIMPPGEKQLVSMGTKIIIFPDKLYYDTYSGEKGALEAFFTSVEGVNVRYSLSRFDATDYSYEPSPTAPLTPSDGALWCDTSSSPVCLKVYSESSGVWVAVESVYVKISCPGIGLLFSKGDGVEISGSAVDSLNTVTTITARDDDFIIVPGIIDSEKVQSSCISVSRRTPVMDFVTECDNRLWGCRWGLNDGGVFVNEIYSCKLGDPFNWHCYEGISTDSYRASLGSDGPFTGAVTYLGSVLFFKENMLHKVFGTKPANFQVTGLVLRGVKRGCHRSLCIIDEVLYYAGQSGILAYDGSLPCFVSEKLGDTVLRDVICAGGEYSLYVSALDSENSRQLYVFNTRRGIWHRFSPASADALCNFRGVVFMASGGGLWALDASGDRKGEIEELFGLYERSGVSEWFFETGDIAPKDGRHSYVTKIQLRVKVCRGAHIRIQMKCAGCDDFKSVGVISPVEDGLFTIPVITGRCHSLRLRLSGCGSVIIYSIGKYTERVSEYSGG